MKTTCGTVPFTTDIRAFHTDMACLRDLPVELLEQIVSRLPLAGLSALACTCRDYYRLLNARVYAAAQHTRVTRPGGRLFCDRRQHAIHQRPRSRPTLSVAERLVCRGDHIDGLRKLLETETGTHERTIALYAAIEHGRHDMAIIAMNCGASLSPPHPRRDMDDDGVRFTPRDSPLTCAVRIADADMVRLVLHAQAARNPCPGKLRRDESLEALAMAVQKRRACTLQELLNRGVGDKVPDLSQRLWQMAFCSHARNSVSVLRVIKARALREAAYSGNGLGSVSGFQDMLYYFVHGFSPLDRHGCLIHARVLPMLLEDTPYEKAWPQRTLIRSLMHNIVSDNRVHGQVTEAKRQQKRRWTITLVRYLPSEAKERVKEAKMWSKEQVLPYRGDLELLELFRSDLPREEPARTEWVVEDAWDQDQIGLACTKEWLENVLTAGDVS